MINRSNELRQNNREAVLREILIKESLSRHEIIEETGLAPSTVSTIIKEICEEGIICSKGKLNTSGIGRKSDVFARNGSHASVLVINLTLESSSVVLVDLEFNIRSETSLQLESHETDAVADAIIPIINRYFCDFSNSIQFLVLSLPHYPYNKDRLKTLVGEYISLPVYVINNVEAMGLYDSRFFYEPFHSLVYIYVGQGIGSAYFHGGELLMGENGFASDLGHIHITDKPLLCRCGRQGCLETVASENSLNLSLKNLNKITEVLKGDSLISCLKNGIDNRDRTVQDLVTRTASHLSESILTVISLLDPQAIILTGRIIGLNPFLSQKLEEHLYNKSGLRSLFSNKLIYQDYKPDSAARGAALYAFLSAYTGFNRTS